MGAGITRRTGPRPIRRDDAAESVARTSAAAAPSPGGNGGGDRTVTPQTEDGQLAGHVAARAGGTGHGRRRGVHVLLEIRAAPAATVLVDGHATRPRAARSSSRTL